MNQVLSPRTTLTGSPQAAKCKQPHQRNPRRKRRRDGDHDHTGLDFVGHVAAVGDVDDSADNAGVGDAGDVVEGDGDVRPDFGGGATVE